MRVGCSKPSVKRGSSALSAIFGLESLWLPRVSRLIFVRNQEPRARDWVRRIPTIRSQGYGQILDQKSMSAPLNLVVVKDHVDTVVSHLGSGRSNSPGNELVAQSRPPSFPLLDVLALCRHRSVDHRIGLSDRCQKKCWSQVAAERATAMNGESLVRMFDFTVPQPEVMVLACM